MFTQYHQQVLKIKFLYHVFLLQKFVKVWYVELQMENVFK